MPDLLDVFPFIQKSKMDFEHHNKLLNKVTLTGKINSDERTTNLFQFAENTSINFSQLKDKLIDLLLKHNLETVINELQLKADVTINILIRNLFERTADVGFLATDTQIIEYLNNPDDQSKENLKLRLHEYVLKYSVYNEIVVFDTLGNVMVNLNKKNKITSTSDPIIEKTLKSDSFVERLEHTDIFKAQEKTLTYTHKIVDNGNTIGVLCLCFKFEDELKRIFDDFKSSNETILLVEKNRIIASNKPQEYPLNTHFQYIKEEYRLLNNAIAVSAKASGYQGYEGLPWFSVVIRTSKDIDKEKHVNTIKQEFINEEIKAIITQADNIVEDLSDIIINGELIAAKRRMYLLNPILDNLRIISSDLLRTIKNAGDNLESLVQHALKFNLLSSSKLAINIMDRNLYERANDSRWWALTPLFINELSSPTPDVKKLNDVLIYINDLYTVYTNLFIYDGNGRIIASSKEPNIIGKTIHSPEVNDTLSNKDTQHYFVSKFEKTEFYKNEATYIYHATINSPKKTVGGIGVVFDSTVEFEAILNDSVTADLNGISLFIDSKAMVISSTSAKYKPTSHFPLDDTTLSSITSKETFYGIVELDNTSYILASALSYGYREYKVSDNYKNSVIALTLYKL